MAKDRRFLFFPGFLLLLISFAQPQERPKVGLVLSGAGAKGIAHVPVLKLLDELDFPVDFIAGTSAGGIMGGLYAAGYSGAEIEQIISIVDWVDLFSDRPPRGLRPFFEKRLDGRYLLEFPLRKGIPSTPRGLIAGQKFFNLFSSVFFPLPGDLDFDDLPIPFRCVAVDIITGNQVVLKKGSLARALRATMAIPTIFAPVEWDEYMLVDGGLLNNLPVDVIKDMGADIVIAVDLANPLNTREELATAEKILGQSLQVVEAEQKKDKLSKVDLLIWPDMKGLSSTDYFFPEKLARIKERGEEAARNARPALQALKEKLSLTRSLKNDAVKPLGRNQKRVLGQVVFKGNKKIPSSFIAQLFGLRRGEAVDAALISRKLNEIYALGYFEDIQYEVFPYDARTIDLRLTVRELPRGKLRVGLHYDNYYKLVAAAGLYATNYPFAGLRLENEIEAAGLTRILAKVSYPTKTLNFPVYPLIFARYDDVPTRLFWPDGRIITTYKGRSFSLGAGLGFLLKKSLNLELAYVLEKMNIKPQAEFASLRSSPALKSSLRKVELAATLDTLDDRRDPKKGLLFRGLFEGSYESLGSESAYELTKASLDIYTTLRGKNTFRLYGYWGTTRGDAPFYKRHNLGYTAAFVGMAYDELQGDTVKIVRADYSYRYTSLVQFKLITNLALGLKQRWPEITYAPDTLWGMGVGVAVNTPLGLLELIYGLGSKSLSDPRTVQSAVYLELGTRF